MILRRNRRLRTTQAIRNLVRETSIAPTDFIVPVFVVEGQGIKQEIPSMPNYYRYSLDLMQKEILELWSMGLKSVLLFVKVAEHLKDNKGTEAINPQGLMQRAIKAIKDVCPEMLVMTDVALDPYSKYGHDGIVAHIRSLLEQEGFHNTGIMSYSAKYASAFYGPFRDALQSAPVDLKNIPKDKQTYQMDPANRKEAIKETLMDIEEGADIVMVKPGLCYLDIVRDVRDAVDVPVAVYQVSGEYAMLKAAAEKGWLDHDAVMMEQLLSIKRAGAHMIASYFAKDAVRLL
jgi:porphobilinogen synthase